MFFLFLAFTSFFLIGFFLGKQQALFEENEINRSYEVNSRKEPISFYNIPDTQSWLDNIE